MRKYMNIPMDEIKNIADSKSYTRGVALRRRNMVYGIKSEYKTEDDIHISGYVEGSYDNEYYVSMYFDEKSGEIYDYQCECPAYHQYRGMCKHCVALALSFSNAKEGEKPALAGIKKGSEVFGKQTSASNKPVVTSKEISSIIFNSSMENKLKYMQPNITGKIDLIPTLYRTYWGWSVDFKIGAEHRYILKDINKLLVLIDGKEEFSYGMKLKFIHDYSAFTKDAQKIIEFLRNYMKTYKYTTGKGAAYIPAIRELELPNQALVEFLHIMCGRHVAMANSIIDSRFVSIVSGNPILRTSLEKARKGTGYIVKLPALESIGDKEKLFIRVLDRIYECDAEFAGKMQPICSICDYFDEKTYNISEKDMPSFCTTVLPVLSKYTDCKCIEDIEEYVPQEAVIKIYLDKTGEKITCKLNAEYGNQTYNILTNINMQDAFRDVEKESYAQFKAMQYFDNREAEVMLFLNEKDEEKVYNLVMDGIEELKETGEVYVSDSFKKLHVNSSPKISVGVSIKAGLLELNIDTGDFPQNELDGILQNYRAKKKYYRLKSGDFVSLEDNSLAVLSEMADTLAIKNKDIARGNIQLPQFRAMYVEQLLKESDVTNLEVKKDKEFKAMIRDIKSFEDSDFEVPETLDQVMKEYQKTGYRWLRTIDKLGFGGILADDMGLGKSIQVIAYLISKKLESQERRTSLIVCPASLVYNWENEINKFGEQLKTIIVAGNTAERKDNLVHWKEYDVVVTSYDLLKRDIEEYEDLSFYSMIIDEAQNIKNHTTLAAKAVKQITANVRFALTGTPIENRLSELWSIFDFLMPGLLYSYQKFKKDYEIDIIQNSDEDSVRKLQRMIKPFIMRRVKEDVLKEIPDKNEEIIYSKLSGEQEKLYFANLQQISKGIKQKSAEDFNSNKLQILSAITRLRQICCAPALVYEDYKGESAKMDTCMELILNAIEGGHKILLFSQFTSVFDLLEHRLQKEKISFFRLDGTTNKLRRSEMVDEFNEDETPLFLISLKAGGTGLNLTSASIVIHFDPWWNIAAQNQATDRTHRIGQTKVVSVFKLIAKNTIEEKILKLQDAKKDLSDQIINEGGASIASLTKEDFEQLLEE